MTLPVTLVDNLDYVARQLQVSRSGLVSELLSEPLQVIRDLVEDSLAVEFTDDEVTQRRKLEPIKESVSAIQKSIMDMQKDSDNRARQLFSIIDGGKSHES